MPTIPLLTICATSADGSQSFLNEFRRMLATPDVPARTGYWLSRIHKLLVSEVTEFHAARDKLITNLGSPIEGKPGEFSLKPENVEKFKAEILSLERDVDLGVPHDLKLALPATFTPEDWLPLMNAVDLFEEPQ